MAELGEFEIHVVLDNDHLKVDAPGIQSSGSPAQAAAREKPKLPFLDQVHSLRPTSPGELGAYRGAVLV